MDHTLYTRRSGRPLSVSDNEAAVDSRKPREVVREFPRDSARPLLLSYLLMEARTNGIRTRPTTASASGYFCDWTLTGLKLSLAGKR